MATTNKKAKEAGMQEWAGGQLLPTKEEKVAKERWELLDQLNTAVRSAAELKANGLPVPTTLTQAIDLLSAKLYVAVQ